MNIAIQGILGSFHDIAARRYFGDTALHMHCCDTFEAVFEALRDETADLALVAIENTTPGACSTTTNSCWKTPSPWWANTSSTSNTHSCACPMTIGTPSPK